MQRRKLRKKLQQPRKKKVSRKRRWTQLRRAMRYNQKRATSQRRKSEEFVLMRRFLSHKSIAKQISRPIILTLILKKNNLILMNL